MTCINYKNDNSTTNSPVAGWLAKMVPLPFGRSRWILRFFVLLDSELRLYKNEHSESTSQILDLRQVCQVISTRTSQRPCCFRLEPKLSCKSNKLTKPWIIECKSKIDMENWISAIQSKITKHSSSFPCVTPTKAVSTCSTIASSNLLTEPLRSYRIPILPLRCTNLTENINDDEDEKENGDNDFPSTKKNSLLARRNKKLAPIVTQENQPSPCYSPHQNTDPSMKSIASSITVCSSNLASPTGAIFGPIISPGIINRYYYNNDAIKSSRPSFVIEQSKSSITVVGHQEDGDVNINFVSMKNNSVESSSPTYLTYKRKFHL